MIHSHEYVIQLIDALQDLGIKRFMLPDTLGILTPNQTYDFSKDMIARYPNLRFDFHAHRYWSEFAPIQSYPCQNPPRW